MKQIRYKNYKPFLGIFIVSLFLVLPQILNNSLVLGADSVFHFNRIYDVYMQIKTGNINFFQSNYGFQQSGRIVNALYGPGFAYGLGILLVIVHSWIKFQIITSFLLFFTSGCSMYFLSRDMHATKKISLLTAFLFMGSFWITSWSTNQNFMAWGTMLMPLIVLAGLKMINNNAEDLKIIPLALVVALIVQVHMLSTIMAIAVLVVFFVVGMFKTSDKIKLLVKCLLSGVLALILTFNVWGAMLDVFTSNQLYSPFAEQDMSDWTMNISTGDYDYKHLGLVMSVIFIAQIVSLFLTKGKLALSTKLVTIMGTVFLILSSNILPWAKLASTFPPLQSFLQFPYRFNTFAMVLLLAGLSATVSSIDSSELRKKLEIMLMVSCSFVLLQAYSVIQNRNEYWNSSQPIARKSGTYFLKHYDNNQFTNAFRSSNLGLGLDMIKKATPDYLPKYNAGTNTGYADYDKEIIRNDNKLTKTVKNGSLMISWTAMEKGESIKLPIIVYSNSVLLLNGHTLSKDKINLSTIGSPVITSAKKGENTLILKYHSNLITGISLAIVIIAWLISLLSMAIFYFKKYHKTNKLIK